MGSSISGLRLAYSISGASRWASQAPRMTKPTQTAQAIVSQLSSNPVAFHWCQTQNGADKTGRKTVNTRADIDGVFHDRYRQCAQMPRPSATAVTEHVVTSVLICLRSDMTEGRRWMRLNRIGIDKSAFSVRPTYTPHKSNTKKRYQRHTEAYPSLHLSEAAVAGKRSCRMVLTSAGA